MKAVEIHFQCVWRSAREDESPLAFLTLYPYPKRARSMLDPVIEFDIRTFPVLVDFSPMQVFALVFYFIFLGEVSGEGRQRPLPPAKMRDRSVVGSSKKGVLVGDNKLV